MIVTTSVNTMKIRSKSRICSWLIHFILLILATSLYGQEDNNPSLFNERGFLESNKVRWNSQGEIVSNFDGNLSFSKTLFSHKGRKGTNLSIALTYNGNVAHSSNRGTDASQPVNMPEWILNVNGIGVQVFSFPSYYLLNQDADGDTYESGDCMVEGFAKNSTIRDPQVRKLFFLTGDGGLREFNRVSRESSTNFGGFKPSARSDFAKAYFLEKVLIPNTPPVQLFNVFEPDGSIICYKLIDNPYDTGNQVVNNSIQMFVPYKITNRFGGVIEFVYEIDPNGYCLMPLLTRIITEGTHIEVGYTFVNDGINRSVYVFMTLPENNLITINAEANGQYNTSALGTGTYAENNHLQVTSITDILGKETTFEYSSYERKLRSVYPIWGTSVNVDFYYKFKEKRLEKVFYPNGGHSKITYLPENDDLTPDYIVNSTHLTSVQAKACGRDGYMTNMVEKFEVFEDNAETSILKQREYQYTWNQSPTTDPYRNMSTYEYYTGITEKSHLVFPSTIEKKYTYKKIPYHDGMSFFCNNNMSWAVKLLREENINMSHALAYQWDYQSAPISENDNATLNVRSKKKFDSANQISVESYVYDQTDGMLTQHIDVSGNRKEMTYYHWDSININTGTGVYGSGKYFVTLSENEYLYDASNTHLTSFYTARDANYGRPTTETVTDESSNVAYSKHYTYFSPIQYSENFEPANVRSITDYNGNTTIFGYDYTYLSKDGLPATVYQNLFTGSWWYKKNEVTNLNGTQVELRVNRTYSNSDAIFSRVTSQKDYNENTMFYHYDGPVRLQGIQKPYDATGDTSTTIQYKDTPPVKTIVTQRMNKPNSGFQDQYQITENIFDEIDRLKETCQLLDDGSSQVTSYTFTPQDLKSSVTNAVGNTTQYKYDDLGRLIKTTNEGGTYSTVSYSYVLRSTALSSYPWPGSWSASEYAFVKTETDEKSNTLISYFDIADQLRATKTINNSHNIFTYFNYDALGNLKTVQDPEGLLTEYEYNNLGRLLSKISSDAGKEEYIYDNNGNVRFTRNAQQTIDQTFTVTYYDEMNRPILIGEEKNSPNAWNVAGTVLPGITNTTYGIQANEWKIKNYYDINFISGIAANTKGQLSKSEVNNDDDNAAEQITCYAYDKDGNNVEKQLILDDGTALGEKVIRYEYDMLGNVTEMIYPTGRTIGHSYDEVGRLSNITQIIEGMDPVKAEIKVFLEGPYSTSTDEMYTALQACDYIPTTSPYSENIRTVSAIPPNTVDWVLLELRETVTGAAVLSRSVFLRKDGYLVADDGTTTQLEFVLPEGDYYVVIKHRNHLAVMSANAIALNTTQTILYDFTSAVTQYMGDGAVLLEAGVYGAYTGDSNFDGNVTVADNNEIMRNWNDCGYENGDVNLDGNVTVADNNSCMIHRNVGINFSLNK